MLRFKSVASRILQPSLLPSPLYLSQYPRKANPKRRAMRKSLNNLILSHLIPLELQTLFSFDSRSTVCTELSVEHN